MKEKWYSVGSTTGGSSSVMMVAALVSDVSGGVVSGDGVSPQPTRQSSMHRQSKSSFFIVNLAYRNRVSPL